MTALVDTPPVHSWGAHTSRNCDRNVSVNAGWVHWMRYCVNKWLNVKEKSCHVDSIGQYSLSWCFYSIDVVEVIHG